MNRFQTKNLVTIFAILVLVGIAANIIFFIIIKHTVQDAYLVEARLQAQADEENKKKSIQSLIQNLQGEITGLASRVIPKDGVAGFIEQIETLAKNDGVSVIIQTIDKVGKNAPHPDSYEFLSLSLMVNGPWTNTYRFMSQLENLPYKINLINFSLTQNSQAQADTTISTTTTKKTTVVPHTTWSGNFSLLVLKHK